MTFNYEATIQKAINTANKFNDTILTCNYLSGSSRTINTQEMVDAVTILVEVAEQFLKDRGRK